MRHNPEAVLIRQHHNQPAKEEENAFRNVCGTVFQTDNAEEWKSGGRHGALIWYSIKNN